MNPAVAQYRINPPYGEWQLDERRAYGVYR